MLAPTNSNKGIEMAKGAETLKQEIVGPRSGKEIEETFYHIFWRKLRRTISKDQQYQIENPFWFLIELHIPRIIKK